MFSAQIKTAYASTNTSRSTMAHSQVSFCMNLFCFPYTSIIDMHSTTTNNEHYPETLGAKSLAKPRANPSMCCIGILILIALISQSW